MGKGCVYEAAWETERELLNWRRVQSGSEHVYLHLEPFSEGTTYHGRLRQIRTKLNDDTGDKILGNFLQG